MPRTLRLERCDDRVAAGLAASLDMPLLVARLLCLRGITTAEEAKSFLFPRIEDLSDPFTLPDIGPATARVAEAARQGEVVGIFADYDADGISSAALLTSFLKQAGVRCEVYIPRREEGYGLSVAGVRALREAGASLLVCLDCGTSNDEEIRAAQDMGMDTIVIDHHEVGADHANPLALVNPKRPDSLFPTRELAACGVTFFFLLAMRRVLHEACLLPTAINLKRELDITTLGTVADMVPLVKDNRLIVRFGFEAMRLRPRTWLRSFLKRKLLPSSAVDEYGMGFIVAPRINAAGRLSEPLTAFRFLTSKDESESAQLLVRLDQANRMRQTIEESIVAEAVDLINRDGLQNASGLVVYSEKWPVGVIGIVAQRLAEKYARPAVVLTRIDGLWKGSARGVEGMDLYATVSSLGPLLLRCGGHTFACGLSLKDENLLPFREAFDRATQEVVNDGLPELSADAVVSFAELNEELVRCLDLLAPFGNGNPRPRLVFRPASVSVRNRFVTILDDTKKTWYGSLQGRARSISGTMTGSLIAAPYLREEMEERFIRLAVRDLIEDLDIVT